MVLFASWTKNENMPQKQNPAGPEEINEYPVWVSAGLVCSASYWRQKLPF
jgi:hypothetical protein